MELSTFCPLEKHVRRLHITNPLLGRHWKESVTINVWLTFEQFQPVLGRKSFDGLLIAVEVYDIIGYSQISQPPGFAEKHGVPGPVRDSTSSFWGCFWAGIPFFRRFIDPRLSTE